MFLQTTPTFTFSIRLALYQHFIQADDNVCTRGHTYRPVVVHPIAFVGKDIMKGEPYKSFFSAVPFTPTAASSSTYRLPLLQLLICSNRASDISNLKPKSLD